MSRQSFVSALALALLVSTGASAQNINKAIDAFRAGNFEDAASQFYAVLRFDDEPGNLVEAQYGLAKSFERLGLNVSALKYYENIVREGSVHPYFDKAVEGLLDVSDALNDDFKVPPVLDSVYEREFNALSKLKPEIQQRMNFAVGRHAFNRQNIADARAFLGTVKESNIKYPEAQYMLGLIALGVGRPDAPEPDYETALERFENARRVIGADAKDDELRNIHDLATLAIGRASYERAYKLDESNPAEAPSRDRFLRQAVYEYRKIPRFSRAWSDSLFERAWAFTVATEVENNYGKALGSIHSLRAPYFADQFYPESNILESIIYFYNCQWDRVNEVLDRTKMEYGPVVDRLTSLNESNLEFDEWYALLQRSIEAGSKSDDPDLIPWGVAVRLSRDERFNKFERFLQELDREAAFFRSNGAFNRSEMGREMTDFAMESREAFVQVLGRLVKQKVLDATSELSDITTRASIVSLETKTAEIEWLEAGREIQGQKRARLPRPFIPSDEFQFWWFRGEYWMDELGYFEYTIKSECLE